MGALRQIRARFAALSPNVQGMAWMAMAGMVFASFMAIVRHVSLTLPPIEAAFIRYAFGLLFMLPAFMRMTTSDFRHAGLKLHCFRGLLHGIGVMCWFYSMSRIPITEVTAIGFSAPVFAVVGAALFPGERIRLRRMAAVIVGLTGALVIIRPGFVTVDPGALAMLVAAPLFAVSDIVAKLLTRRESGPAVVAYLSVFVTLVTLGPALYVWRTPTMEETLLLALTAALATIGHLMMIQGIKVAEMSAIQPGKFLQLVWAALVGYLVFREVPEVWTWIGAALIIGSATYITHREAQIRRRALEAQDAQSNSTNSG